MAVTWRVVEKSRIRDGKERGQFTYGMFGDLTCYQLSHLSSLTCPYDAFISCVTL
jgi:hypothetical protein